MKRELNIRLTNSASSKGNDRWNWSVWLEGEDHELDQIKAVEYILHPTFRNPHRIVTDRNSNFRLDSNGWGEFMIHAKITTVHETTFNMDHWLRLSEEGEEPAPTRAAPTEMVKKPKRVYLSFGNADLYLASQVGKFLQEHGVEVVTGNDITAGESIGRAIQSSIGHSDSVVALVSNESSQWVNAEIEEANKQGKDLIPFILGKGTNVPTALEDILQTQLPDATDSETMVDKAKSALEKKFGFQQT